MKKITLLIVALIFITVTNAQTLTYNTDNVVGADNSVGCGGDDNWARNFILADFPTLPANFQLISGTIGVLETAPFDEDIVVNVYASDGNFPTSFGTSTLLRSQTVTIPTGSDLTVIDYTFDTAVVVPSGTVALIVVVVIDAQYFFIAGTANEVADSWLRSDSCGPTWTTTTSIGFPDAHFLITVLAEEALGVNDYLAELTSIYPNPTINELHVKLPSNVIVENATLYDILGQDTGVKLVNETMDTSHLTDGIYMLNIKTNAGTVTKKVVK